MRDLDVLCYGEALVDLLPDSRGRLRDCERFHVHSGGAPANVAVGLARLGRAVAFAGAVGDDEFGHLLARKLEAERIETHLRFDPQHRTGMWFVALDAQGNRSFFSPTGATSADKHLTAADLPQTVLQRAHWLHVGSSSHVLPAARGLLLDAVLRARALGVKISFDPNLRLHLWRDPRELRRLVRGVFPHCALVKLADDEVALCTGEADPAAAAAWLVEQGVGVACITLGAQGALVRRGREVLTVPAPQVDVVDTTGAGDGFVAGVLARLGAADPLTLALSAIEDAARFGCQVGARVCAALGAVAGLPHSASDAEPARGVLPAEPQH